MKQKLNNLLAIKISQRQAKTAALVVMGVVLVSASASAMAATMNFPIIDDLLCGFNNYLRNRFAPMIGAIVIIMSMIGHWLGAGKVWAVLMYVGMGLGLIFAIGGLIASYTSAGASCLTTTF
jgi:uncharacterized membrane protein